MISPIRPHGQPQPLRILRRNALYTQRELAEKADVTASTIYLIEKGRTQTPQLVIMRKICEALGCKPQDIREFATCLGWVR